MGIVNGTTNYILTRMTEDGASYDDALAEAQTLGYAEPDPTADVEGFDAAAKAAIIASIAFGAKVVAGDVYREGISGITAADIAFADQLGYVVKLLAIAEQVDGRGVAVRVHPAMVPKTHPLASVRDSFNAVFIEGEAVGELMLYGRGAGGMPTASAVLGDLIDAAHNLRAGGAGPGAVARPGAHPAHRRADLAVLPHHRRGSTGPACSSRWPASSASHDVSIRSMEQDGLGDEARLIFITHTARERDMQATLHDLRQLDAVERLGSLLRVIGPARPEASRQRGLARGPSRRTAGSSRSTGSSCPSPPPRRSSRCSRATRRCCRRRGSPSGSAPTSSSSSRASTPPGRSRTGA